MATIRISRLRWLRVVVPLLVVAAILSLSIGAEATGTSTTVIPFQASGYSYTQVEPGGLAGFEAVGYSEAGWSVGQAGFGTVPGTCSWNTADFIHSNWDPNTDILIRKHFTLPLGASNLHVSGTVDNDATVYVNGNPMYINGDPLQGSTVTSGFCNPDAITLANLQVANSALKVGDNVLAIRGHDYGDATYLDVQVTYDACPVTVVARYDTTKSHAKGSTVPIKLELDDCNGTNISSSYAIHATGLKQVDTSASATLDDAGSSNSPDMDFRYSSADNFQIFNLQTSKSMATGTWQVTYTIAGQSDPSYVARFDLK